MDNHIFIYNNQEVTFQLSNGDTMVNASQMGKAFGKKPNDYLKTKSAKELMYALSKSKNVPLTNIVYTNHGGNTQGTWMHEDLALDYAQWLSVDFKIWCNKKLKELMTTGSTSIMSEDEQILNTVQLLIARTEKQSEVIKEQAPKVKYHDEVLAANGTYTANQLAKDFGFVSAQAFNQRLNELKVQYKQTQTWMLYSKYAGKGYTTTKTHTYTDNSGELRTSLSMVWTQSGRKFLFDLFAEIETEKINLLLN